MGLTFVIKQAVITLIFAVFYINPQLKHKYLCFWEQMAATLKFYFWFRFWLIIVSGMQFCINVPSFIEIRPTKAELRCHIGCSTQWPQCKSTSRFRYGDVVHLRRGQSICRTNLSKIWPTTAEILLLLVSENKQPPYWNSASSFDFGLDHVIITASDSASLTNFVWIGWSANALWHHINFLSWRPPRRKCTSGCGFGDVPHLRRSKIICSPKLGMWQSQP